MDVDTIGMTKWQWRDVVYCDFTLAAKKILKELLIVDEAQNTSNPGHTSFMKLFRSGDLRQVPFNCNTQSISWEMDSRWVYCDKDSKAILEQQDKFIYHSNPLHALFPQQLASFQASCFGTCLQWARLSICCSNFMDGTLSASITGFIQQFQQIEEERHLHAAFIQAFLLLKLELF